MTFKKAILSAVIHIVELAVLLGAAWFVLSFLDLDSETTILVTTGVVGFLVKLARTWESIPLLDYVNK